MSVDITSRLDSLSQQIYEARAARPLTSLEEAALAICHEWRWRMERVARIKRELAARRAAHFRERQKFLGK